MDGTGDEIEEIDFSKVDWNSLNIDEFNSLEEKLAERDRRLKEDKVRKPRVENRNVAVSIRGKNYEISLSLYGRLREIKSEKSKQKLIDEIVTSHNPILEI
jgi:hypothetical protein